MAISGVISRLGCSCRMCSGNENVLQLQEDSRGDIDTVTNKMQDLPECVLERLFKHLDVRRLKACRLVSKKWNKEACLVLRKRTSTYFVNNETVGCRNRYSDFKELMKTRDPQNTLIPVPFECFDICLYVRFSNLEEFCQGVDNILEKTRGEVWKLKVGLGPTANSPNELDLYPFLEKHSRTMTHFEVETGFSCKLPQLRVKNLEFPSLKSLTFGISEAADDTIKDLIVQSINGSQRLNHATIHADRRTNARNIPGTNVLLDLMALPKFGTIQSLSFDVSSSIAMASVIRGLKSLQQLVALEFRYTRNQSFKPPDDLTIDLLKTLRQFSEQIQYLDLGNFQLNRNLVDAYFPFCPCLKSLGMWEFQPGSHYFHKAPNLKMFVFYQNCSPPDIASESIVCHEAVESINIDETKQLSLPDFGFLQKQFPNCKQLRMHTSLANQYFSAALKDESIVAGWKKLESLVLFGNAPTDSKIVVQLMKKWEPDIAGMRDSVRIDVTNSGILDEQRAGLKTIVLDWQYIDTAMIEQLASMKYLQNLHINWSKYVVRKTFVNVVKTSNHLKEVGVMNCCQTKFTTEMAKLYAELSKVCCGCKLDFKKYVQCSGSSRCYHQFTYFQQLLQ